MSRTLIVRCHECFVHAIRYKHGETKHQVKADLRRRGWRKDRKGNDLCPYCVKAKGTAKLKAEG